MLIVSERNLTRFRGHNHTQISAIRDLSGVEVLHVLTSNSANVVSDAGEARFHPVLLNHRAARGDAPGPQVRDTEAILGLLDRIAPGERAEIVIPTALSADIRLALHLAAHHADRIGCHLRILDDMEVERLSDAERDALARAIAAGQISLLTELDAMVDRLKDRFGLDATSDLLLPCTEYSEPADAAPAAQGARRFRVGFLGFPRREKGAKILPDILEALQGALPETAPDLQVEIVLEDTRWLLHRPRFYSHNRRIKRAGAPPRTGCHQLHLDWYPTGLDAAAFSDLTRGLDMMLLPYDAEIYRYRGSGMVIDAALFRLPVVHSRGLGMGELLSQGHAIGVDTAEEFARAIIETGINLDERRRCADAANTALMARIERARGYLRALVAA